jgi:Lecithin retinol acyltransferase
MSRARRYAHGRLRDTRGPKRCQQGVWGLRRYDRLLVAEEEPPLGSHLVTPRRGFTHHGIYVGRGNVVHYISAVRRFCRGPVEEVSLARFALGRAIWIRIHTTPRFEGAEVARRARSRVGEDGYRLLSNNCEHFCEWCLRDEERSYQVERLLSLPQQLARVCAGAATALLPAGSGAFD